MRVRLAILPFVLLLSAVAGAEDADSDAELIARLRAHVEAAEWREALETADRAIADRPESVVAWQYRAYALHRLGRGEEAGTAYEKTVALDPRNWWAHLNLAELRASQGRTEAAVAAAERAVALNPRSVDVRTRVSRIHREAGDFETALSAARLALDAGVDPTWSHAELGYLYWVLGHLEKSREHWRTARESGAPIEDCRHGLRLVEWDRPRGSSRERAEVASRRRGFGEEWVFDVEGIEVHTRVGPRLPREIEKLIGELKKDQAKVLGLNGDESFAVYLHLSRTIEEHEVHRRREFPEGYSERAFVVPRWRRGGGRPGFGRRRDPPPRHELDVYLAWSVPGLERSLAHELAHAMVRLRMPRASWPPVWLDEGIATYLELTPDERGRLEVGRVREDLLATLRQAKEDGNLLPLRALCGAERPAFTGSLARVRYAQSWALVHFLLEGRKSGGARRWKEFLDRWNAPGRPGPGEYLEKVYGGTLEEIEKALAEHLKGLS